jgi:hypothetical protein
LYAIIADKKPKEQFYVTYIRISEKYYWNINRILGGILPETHW